MELGHLDITIKDDITTASQCSLLVMPLVYHSLDLIQLQDSGLDSLDFYRPDALAHDASLADPSCHSSLAGRCPRVYESRHRCMCGGLRQ